MPAIITPRTAAKTEQFAFQRNQMPVRITAPGLAGAEKVVIKAAEGDGTITAVLTDLEGNPIELTAGVQVIELTSHGLWNFEKSATAGAVGVFANI